MEHLMNSSARVAYRTTLCTLILSFTLLAPSIALAQHTRPDQWHLFASGGGWSEFGGAQVGGGIGYERLFFKGLGAGADLEAFGGSTGGFLASANASYHFRGLGAGKVVPFGTIGVSLGQASKSDGDAMGGYNFGGGINYWIKPNRGFRAEFRDHMLAYDVDTYKWELRLGFAF